jgi:hypothetical protein
MPEKPSDPLLKSYGALTPTRLIGDLRPRIERRVKLLYNIYHEFASGWKGIILNPHLLFESVSSAYCDIYRLKFFRDVPWIDDHKKAAFTMKWISRIRPIQIYHGIIPTAASIKVNSYYAIVSGLSILKVKEGWKKDEWWERWITNMVYLLHYHSVSVELLSSELFVLKSLDEARK